MNDLTKQGDRPKRQYTNKTSPTSTPVNSDAAPQKQQTTMGLAVLK